MDSFEEGLKPCINVLYVDSYRRVLKSIVEGYRDRKSGVSFYHLYKKERVLSSANVLKKVLDTLLSCGYVAYESSSAETNSPMGRKDYYPTPLGVFIYEILKLLEDSKKLHFKLWNACEKLEELDEGMDIEKQKEVIKMCINEIERAYLYYNDVALIRESLEKTINTFYTFTKYLLLTKSSNAPNLNTGSETASYALYTLLIELSKLERMWLDEWIQNYFTRERLVKEGEYALRHTIELLKNIREMHWKLLYLSHETCEGIEKDREPVCIEMELINSLENALTLVTELIKGSQKEDPTSQATSPVS